MKMDLYTWGGIYFGKRDRDDLWTYDGRHVGRFWGPEVFDKRGRYIGELKDGKLITDTSKRSSRSGTSFTPYPNRVGHVPYADHVGSVMLAGYEDFPSPLKLQTETEEAEEGEEPQDRRERGCPIEDDAPIQGREGP